MAGDESGRQPSFKVQDRRRFSATGEARDEVADEHGTTATAAEPPPPAESQPPAAAEADRDADVAHAAAEALGAEITFASFIFSLSTQALIHLGEMPDPVDGSAHENLEGARQIIDILAILGEKTRGNLDAAESSLLESALYDLRMRYVDRARHR
jgi:hypothetical protein